MNDFGFSPGCQNEIFAQTVHVAWRIFGLSVSGLGVTLTQSKSHNRLKTFGACGTPGLSSCAVLLLAAFALLLFALQLLAFLLFRAFEFFELLLDEV
jgi:hypothetical protein